jgi:hydroxymethylpyrimidine/phosphomethylpyrimidine kinase
VDKSTSKNIGIIGGTDSSRGSGLSADEETIYELGDNPLTVISAITQQYNSSKIRIHAVPALGLESQLDGLLQEELDAIKIGMLPDESSVRKVGEFLNKSSCKKVILDPVQMTSNGHALITSNGWECLIKDLIPRVNLVTPNLQEARKLLTINDSEKISPISLVKECSKLGAQSILLKGGHGGGEESTDLFLEGENPVIEYKWERITGGTEVRGTGCRLASAISCNWAKTRNLPISVKKAGKYLQSYIRQNAA